MSLCTPAAVAGAARQCQHSILLHRAYYMDCCPCALMFACTVAMQSVLYLPSYLVRSAHRLPSHLPDIHQKMCQEDIEFHSTDMLYTGIHAAAPSQHTRCKRTGSEHIHGSVLYLCYNRTKLSGNYAQKTARHC